MGCWRLCLTKVAFQTLFSFGKMSSETPGEKFLSATKWKALGSCSIPLFLHGKSAVSMGDAGPRMGHHCPWPRCCHRIRCFLWGFVQVAVRCIDLSFCQLPAAVAVRSDPCDICISHDIATPEGASSPSCQELFQCPGGQMSIREQEGEQSVRGSAEARLCKAEWSSHGSEQRAIE